MIRTKIILILISIFFEFCNQVYSQIKTEELGPEEFETESDYKAYKTEFENEKIERIIEKDNYSFLFNECYKIIRKRNSTVKPIYIKETAAGIDLSKYTKDKKFIKQLEKYLSKNEIKEIKERHSFPNFWTWYLSKTDSIEFVKEHRVDDFFYIRDSLRENSNKNSNVYVKYQLYSVNTPLIFHFVNNTYYIGERHESNREKEHIFAFVRFDYYREARTWADYGNFGEIFLYEKIKGAWIRKARVYGYSQCTGTVYGDEDTY